MNRISRKPKPSALTARLPVACSLVFITFFISACGWQLRGTQMAGGQEPSEHLASSHPLSLSVATFRDLAFRQRLTEALASSGFQLSAESLSSLRIEELTVDKRVLTVNHLGQVTRYHLAGRLAARLQHPDQADRWLKVQAVRDYNHDVDRLMASNLEAQQQEQALREELIRLLTQKLERLAKR
jgi:outer membrane lipopolysaccharide assembly protein LptE/RlpB